MTELMDNVREAISGVLAAIRQQGIRPESNIHYPGHRRLKAVTGAELCGLLEAKGWTLRRGQAAIHIYSKRGERKIISLPVHCNRDLKPGLARRIGRDADLD